MKKTTILLLLIGSTLGASAEKYQQYQDPNTLKYGFTNPTTGEKTEAIYTEAHPFTESLVWVHNEKIGLFSLESGQEVVPPKYTGVFPSTLYGSNLTLVSCGKENPKVKTIYGNTIHGNYGLINRQGEEVLSPIYGYIEPLDPIYHVARIKLGKTPFVDLNITVPTDQHTLQSEPIVYPSADWGLMGSDGQLIIEPSLDGIGRVSEGLLCIKQKGKYGFITPRGEIAIPAKYETNPSSTEQLGIYPEFHDGRAVVQQNKRFGTIDPTDQTITPFEQKSIRFIRPSSDSPEPTFYGAQSSLNNRYALLDWKSGKAITDYLFTDLRGDTNSVKMGWVTEQKLWYPVRLKDGKRILKEEFAEPIKFSTKHILFSNEVDPEVRRKNALMGNESQEFVFTNLEGDTIVRFRINTYLDVFGFENGYSVVRDTYKQFGVVNLKGEKVIRPQYENANHTLSFENYLIIAKSGKWGAIRLTGDVVIPCKFDSAEMANRCLRKLIIEGGKSEITPELLNRYMVTNSAEPNKYSIKSVIPDTMWDY